MIICGQDFITAMALLMTLHEYLMEAHQSEIDNGHNPKECSYCQALEDAETFIQKWEE